MSSYKEHLRTNEQTNNQDEINEKIKKDYGKFGEILEEQSVQLIGIQGLQNAKGGESIKKQLKKPSQTWIESQIQGVQQGKVEQPKSPKINKI